MCKICCLLVVFYMMSGVGYTLTSLIPRFVAAKVHVLLRRFAVLTWVRDDDKGFV